MSAARLYVHCDGRRYSVRWFSDDSLLWRQILADWRSWFGRHGDAVYCARTRSWSLPLHARGRLVTWAEGWFAPDCQHWDDDDPEEEPEPEPASGRGGGPPPAGAPATIAQAYAALFLRPEAPAGLVEVAYRWWSKQAHPDVGGDGAAMVRLNAAMDTIRRTQEKERSA